MSWQGFQNFRSITGCDDVEAYWRFEGFVYILFGFIAAAFAMLGGTIYVVYRFIKEIELEVSYQNKYGADWKIEFERYHGSLSQAHLRLAVVFLCLMALLVILVWIGQRFHQIHKHKRHDHAVQ